MYSVIVSTIKELCLTKKHQSPKISIYTKEDNSSKTPKIPPPMPSPIYSSTAASTTPPANLSSSKS